jgi:A/G-specific adenine glycosylase
MMGENGHSREIRLAVRRWYRRHGRTLPWRGIADPYRILLSEVMLQQTQVSRVLEKYPAFLQRFPTLAVLSRAPRSAVIIAWRGMGYNNRAVRLHELARTVMVSLHGRLPDSIEEMLRLPGVGKYTAHALLVAVHHRRLPVVDVNVRRLLSRLLFPMRTFDQMKAEADIWNSATLLLPQRSVYAWHQALMDLGATVCTARRPACAECPVARRCVSRKLMRPVVRRRHREEPRFRGTPNRIYRGRVIEELRRAGPGTGMHASLLGKRIHGGYTSADAHWLRSLLAGLESDGLIVTRRNKGGRRMQVMLA